jgi:hypothetical protein
LNSGIFVGVRFENLEFVKSEHSAEDHGKLV